MALAVNLFYITTARQQLQEVMLMSDTQTIEQPRTRNTFASRLLSKELDLRKKTTREIKISPADAAKYANSEATEVRQPAGVR